MEWHNCNNLENKTNYSIKTVLVHYVILFIIIDFQLVNSLKYWKHGISNLLPIVYHTLYPWYIEPPSYGVSNSLPMVYWTSFLWHYEPALLVKMSVQFTMMGFKIPWRKFEPGVKISYGIFHPGLIFQRFKIPCNTSIINTSTHILDYI